MDYYYLCKHILPKLWDSLSLTFLVTCLSTAEALPTTHDRLQLSLTCQKRKKLNHTIENMYQQAESFLPRQPKFHPCDASSIGLQMYLARTDW